MSAERNAPDLTGGPDTRTTRESVYHALFFVSAAVSILTTVGIILVLTIDAVGFFSQYPTVEFLTGATFNVQREVFGVLPLVVGTLLITIGAAVIALPLGVLTAIYLSEYASPRVRSILKPLLEVLAGVPTVVYGYFALVYITPALNVVLNWLNGTLGLALPTLGLFNGLSASIVVGILIIPMVSSISEDAMSAVPDSLRQAGYGLGATKFKVSTTVVVPAAISGIASAFILAISRAIGETMAVTLAAGTSPLDLPATKSVFGVPYVAPADIFGLYAESMATMTSKMIDIAGGDLAGGSISYDAMYAIGLTLFVITLTMNVLSDRIAARYREEYE
ncbi:ABC-type phosphate transport system, permease component [Halorhabdus sp. SVX81]|uniref:phosphate ABC transporter permease subunit PstC n=1 Tax=Halorhabdus sp. SVX81 TaxID=2978283 RepID=UPI0023DBE0B1|nr:phosphate ABC transporter permease subunit PstC [Halorhabdus sp. SVX81]WEL16891.1 ABC-type phosphate transport system, permease component [Halorhabdus sp. SVX81]